MKSLRIRALFNIVLLPMMFVLTLVNIAQGKRPILIIITTIAQVIWWVTMLLDSEMRKELKTILGGDKQ